MTAWLRTRGAPRTSSTAAGRSSSIAPKYVVSSTYTDEDADWNNSTVISEDVAAAVAELREQPGGVILVNGSVTLVQALIEHDLVDEYRLMVFPVVVGSGKRLFGDLDDAHTLRLTDTTPVGPDGVVVLTYAPATEKDQG